MTANQVQIRRDSAANIAAATGAAGEIFYNTTNKRLVVNDGSTLGGIWVPNRIDLQNQSFIAAAAGGTANALTLTVSPAPSAYATYQRFVFKAAADNTASATINVNSLGAKTIKKRTTSGVSALTGSEIQQDGVYAVVYDGTYMQLEDYTQAETTQQFALLGTATASASSTLDFTSMITTTYRTYYLDISDLRCSASAYVYLRTSTNNGSTYDASSSNYAWANYTADLGSSSTETASNSTGATQIQVCANDGTAAASINGRIWFFNPLGTATQKIFHMNIQVNADNIVRGAGIRLSTADVDAVRLLTNTGNFTSGTVRLYGMVTS